ncbi:MULTISPECIES: YggT family protein [Candidatus Ichthyocystis]|uniref:YggT family protein n=1 Tax=Candidatus Ichthyocystis TaxID=2929841 RepID=UPI000B852A61|nr:MULTISPECIES: YggT family protein [Ichthyocystis]
MLREMLSVIVSAIGNFFSYIILLRLIMIHLNMSFHSPIGLFILSVSNPLVTKIRRVIPPLGKMGAGIAAVFIVTIAQGTILALINMGNIAEISIAQLMLASVCKIAFLLTEIYIFSTIAYSILSWISPRNQTLPFFMTIVRPAILTIRKFVNPIANIDISPLLLLLVLNIILVPLRLYIPSWW